MKGAAILAGGLASEVSINPINWFMRGLLVRGEVNLIEGDGEVGKSTLAMKLCATASTGEPLPGSTNRRAPARVIVFGREDSDSMIAARLQAAGARLDLIKIVDAVRFADGSARPIQLPGDAPLLLGEVKAFRAGNGGLELTPWRRDRFDPLEAFKGRSAWLLLSYGSAVDDSRRSTRR
jgi:hypothetical protein